MPHGLPDWGLEGPKSTTYGLDDLGEHAARLGSPNLWDRRGDVVYISNFSDGFEAADSYVMGASCNTGLSCGHTRSGAYSIRVGSNGLAGCHSGIELRMPKPVASRLGAEFSFSQQGEGKIWRIWMNVNDRNRSWYMAVEQRDATMDLWYLGSDGLYHRLDAAVNLSMDDLPDQTLKLVVDLKLQQYVRTIFNDQEFPMTGLRIRDGGGVANAYWIVRFLLYRQVGDVFDEWVDSVILTQNEP